MTETKQFQHGGLQDVNSSVAQVYGLIIACSLENLGELCHCKLTDGILHQYDWKNIKCITDKEYAAAKKYA
jgi:hypothetical protein